ncbi:COG4705 family protein [Paenibacillus cremeus]|uniref:Membrane-anchored protein n=1 Tax=Paenibacillus cremeus TaxID=2163881 RepID=A0A559K4K9_9BACL|nr:hypothetical protein [Paenibacillus cremeus]TVY07013.1 hypothetical protein FPZ49_25980 [Paenibacillus cremeus]
MGTDSKLAVLAKKVPEVTIYFWIIKVLTTGMGEIFSDYLDHQFGVVAGAVTAVLLIGSFLLQMKAKKYVSWIYWLLVTMISIFGTMIADIMSFALGRSPIVSTVFYAALLAVIFIVWYKKEKTLSVDSINTSRREGFYWAMVFATFALGTAAGDMFAQKLHLGFLNSGIIFTILLIVPAVLNRIFNLNKILTFWFAYIMTRPAGASFTDWMCSPSKHGGLGYNQGTVSMVLTIFIIVLVAYVGFTKKDINQEKLILNEASLTS